MTHQPEDAQLSEAGSSFADPETSLGGADAVPDTPDDVPEDNIADADAQDFRRHGRDAEVDRGPDRESDGDARQGSQSARRAGAEVDPER